MRALVVEDDTGIGSVMVSLIEMFGHQALWVSTLHEAESYLEKEPPDVIFLDYWFHSRGLTADRFLEDHAKDKKIVVMSADKRIHSVAEKYALPFLSKPFDIDQLNSFLTPLH